MFSIEVKNSAYDIIILNMIYNNNIIVRPRLEYMIIIMVIFRCYFSREHIALSLKKRCEHRIRKNQQIKNTVHDAKSYLT